MKASEARSQTIQSVQSEIIKITSLIMDQINQGNAKLELKSISDGALLYLIDNGFETNVESISIQGEREVVTRVLIKWSEKTE